MCALHGVGPDAFSHVQFDVGLLINGGEFADGPFRASSHQDLEYQSLLDAGEADSQSELARLCSTPRTTISAYLRLLDLSEEVRAEALSVADDDDRISALTEARLRHLVGRKSKEQQKRLRDLLKQGGAK